MFEDQEILRPIKRRLSFNLPSRFRNRATLIKVLPGVVVVLVLLVVFILGRVTAPKSVTASSTQPTLSAPTATQTLNKSFDFPVKDDKGTSIGSLQYVLESAELSDQIVVQGQKVQALTGRTFLIVDLKITNNNKQNIQMNTRNYVRMSVNGDNSELLAPDIHNDPVEVQAISTKLTKIGFAVNDSDKNFKLSVGEIDGPKTTISLNFHK